jgi:hypothetical protein
VALSNPSVANCPAQVNTEELMLVNGSSVIAKIPPVMPEFTSLGDLISIDSQNYSQVLLLDKIIDCESNWKNICNQKYGCNAGQGIAQLIPTTVSYCDKKLGRKIDPFNEQDSLDCAMWLLENEGYHHWGTDKTNWGSYECFKDFIP